jgi:hypothetical protein
MCATPPDLTPAVCPAVAADTSEYTHDFPLHNRPFLCTTDLSLSDAESAEGGAAAKLRDRKQHHSALNSIKRTEPHDAPCITSRHDGEFRGPERTPMGNPASTTATRKRSVALPYCRCAGGLCALSIGAPSFLLALRHRLCVCL